MITIHSIHPISGAYGRPLNRSTGPSSISLATTDKNIAQPSAGNIADALLLQSLPQAPLNRLADITHGIGTLALEAAELDRTAEDRALIQTSIRENISEARTALEPLSNDHLRVLATLFQNPQVLGTAAPDSPAFYESSQDFFDTFYDFDVTSDVGLFSTLNRTGGILDILSPVVPETDLLEQYLETVTGSFFYLFLLNQLQEGITDGQTDSEGQVAEESDVEQTTETGTAQDQELIQRTTQPLSGLDPLTIIEIAG